jgi:peptidyl-prolyl cis-trans isomerase D
VNKLSQALGAVAVIAIAVVFILQFRPNSNAARTDTGPQCVAEVGGACLAKTRFDAARRIIGARVRAHTPGFNRKVADGLLEAWLLGQDAKRLGISISDEEVTAEIASGRAHVSIPVADIRTLGYQYQLGDDLVFLLPVKSPKTKKFDAKYAEKQIRTYSGMSPSEFRDYQRTEMLAARMRELIKDRVRISENEAFEQFSREKSTVTLDYVRFDRRFFGDLLVDLSPKLVDAWADAHKDEVDKTWDARKAQVMPECRSVREIFIKIDEAPSDEEKAKARARIDHARDRIQKGEEFADVARAVSEGATAPRGGELGCLLKGKAPKPLEEAVAALGAGKVSDVITTDAGLYLVKVEQIAKDADAERLGRAQTAKELYIAHEADRLSAEASKKVAAAVKGGKTMKEALDLLLSELPKAETAPDAKDKKGKKDKKADDKKDDKKKADDDRPALSFANHPARPTLETTLPFNASNDPIPGVRQAAELTKTAFALEKPGDAPPDAFPFENGYVAIQLKEKTPASKELWEKNKEFYLSAMRAAKASDALIAYVKRLQGQLGADAKFTKELVDDKGSKGGDNMPMPSDDDGE